jgi:hypothetical protein
MKFIHKIIIFAFAGCFFPYDVFAMSINPDKYQEVKAGELIYFINEVKYPENDTRKDLRIEYYIMNKDGNEVGYMKVLKAIETQASFMDSITIPQNTEPGMYKIVAKIGDYKDMNEEVGASFHVGKPAGEANKFYLLVILIFVAIIAVGLIVHLAVFFSRKTGTPVKKNLKFA